MAVLRGTSLWNEFLQSPGKYDLASFPQARLPWRNSPCLDSDSSGQLPRQKQRWVVETALDGFQVHVALFLPLPQLQFCDLG